MPKFQPGASGNPKGRPKRTDTEQRQRGDIRKAVPGIIQKLIGLAEDGDIQAAKLLLERVMPPLRPVDRPVSLPLGPTLAGASETVLSALGGGAITPAQAVQIAGTVGSLARTKEIAELDDRLRKIEDQLDATNTD